ncbi:hypothetical protein CYMTET_23937 [Cymbomonas tetramitiformis]|uniref:Acyltransferase 3 domain-containing protein n=1 Tax=Cymbomonas tetramitiformis TaxID=36881 RepID=A0AAE0L0L6_9CHLO|nr:hypothetical protein CYMTET_23937 [Cymbomonas tetramitiformis]
MYYGPVDGLRSLSSLSLVLLHATIVTSLLLPNKGMQWEAFMNNPLVGVFRGGGCQVDVFLMLSGFLLSTRLRTELEPKNGGFSLQEISTSIAKRALRLWPILLLVCLISIVFQDCWCPYYLNRLSLLGFINNYFDVRIYGGFTMTVAWSVCVDFQAGVCLLLVLTGLRAALGRHSAAFAPAGSPRLNPSSRVAALEPLEQGRRA